MLSNFVEMSLITHNRLLLRLNNEECFVKKGKLSRNQWNQVEIMISSDTVEVYVNGLSRFKVPFKLSSDIKFVRFGGIASCIKEEEQWKSANRIHGLIRKV